MHEKQLADNETDFMIHPLYGAYFQIFGEVLPVFENVVKFQDDGNVVNDFLDKFIGIFPEEQL